MNPFVLMTMFSAAQESQRGRNNRPLTPSARRSVFRVFLSNRDAQATGWKRRTLVICGAVAIVSVIAFIIGLIAFGLST